MEYLQLPPLRPATPGLWESLSCMQSLPQPIVLMSVAASGRLCHFTLFCVWRPSGNYKYIHVTDWLVTREKENPSQLDPLGEVLVYAHSTWPSVPHRKQSEETRHCTFWWEDRTACSTQCRRQTQVSGVRVKQKLKGPCGTMKLCKIGISTKQC